MWLDVLTSSLSSVLSLGKNTVKVNVDCSVAGCV